MKAALNWISAALAALVLLSLGACLDTPTKEAQTVADDVEHAQLMAETDARIARTAQAVCLSEMGPGHRARWTNDGQLQCLRFGSQVAKGGPL